MGRILRFAKQTLDALDVGLCNVSGALKATSTGRGLALKEVAAISHLATEFAGAGDLHALCGALVGLLLHEMNVLET